MSLATIEHIDQEQESRERRLQERFAQLYEKGVLFSVSCHGPTFKISNSSTEFGKKETDIPDGMYLGNKLWMPKRVVNRRDTIFGRARNVLRKMAFPFPVAAVHFVPKTKLLEAEESVKECVEELRGWQDDMRSNYEEYKVEMLDKAERYKDSLPGYREALSRTFDMYPIARVLDNTITMSRFQISMPKELESVETMAVLLQEKAIAEKVEGAHQDLERYRREAEATVRKQTEEQMQQLSGFVRTTEQVLCESFKKDFESLRSRILSGEKITRRSTNHVKALIENFRSMDFLNVTEVHNMLNEVEMAVDGFDPKNTSPAQMDGIQKALQDALRVAGDMVESSERAVPFRRLLDE